MIVSRLTLFSNHNLFPSMNNRFNSLLIRVLRFLKRFRWCSSSLLRYLISAGRVSITKYFCICLRSFLRVYEETPPLTGQGGYISKNLSGVCPALLRCSLCHPLSFTTGTLSSSLYLFQRPPLSRSYSGTAKLTPFPVRAKRAWPQPSLWKSRRSCRRDRLTCIIHFNL